MMTRIFRWCQRVWAGRGNRDLLLEMCQRLSVLEAQATRTVTGSDGNVLPDERYLLAQLLYAQSQLAKRLSAIEHACGEMVVATSGTRRLVEGQKQPLESIAATLESVADLLGRILDQNKESQEEAARTSIQVAELATRLKRLSGPGHTPLHAMAAELPIRVRNALVSNGVRSVEELEALDDADLLAMRGIGRSALVHIRHAIRSAKARGKRSRRREATNDD